MEEERGKNKRRVREKVCGRRKKRKKGVGKRRRGGRERRMREK